MSRVRILPAPRPTRWQRPDDERSELDGSTRPPLRGLGRRGLDLHAPTFRSFPGSGPLRPRAMLASRQCGSSTCSDRAGRSFERSPPRPGASACEGSSDTHRSAGTRPCSCAGRGRSTRSACDFRSAPSSSTGPSSSGRSGCYRRADSCSRDPPSVMSSSARREPTFGRGTDYGSSQAPEGPGRRPLYFPALPPGRGRGAV